MCKRLSLFTQKAIPKKENALSPLGVTDFIEVDFVIPTSTNIEYSSIATNT